MSTLSSLAKGNLKNNKSNSSHKKEPTHYT